MAISKIVRPSAWVGPQGEAHADLTETLVRFFDGEGMYAACFAKLRVTGEIIKVQTESMTQPVYHLNVDVVREYDHKEQEKKIDGFVDVFGSWQDAAEAYSDAVDSLEPEGFAGPSEVVTLGELNDEMGNTEDHVGVEVEED